MTFTIIGTGNIAWLLATKLKAAGHACAGIYGRTIIAAQELAAVIDATVINDLSAIPDDNDCCIIAVSDNAIESVTAQLKFNNTVLIHTAGAVSAGALSAAATHYGVLWPVYSVTKNNLPAHRNIPTVCEASSAKAKEILRQIAAAYTDDLSCMDSEQRSWMHLAAVISNNFTNHLFAICEKICAEKNIPFAQLRPIIHQTIERLATTSPYAQQTGPARRGDDAVINKQLDMLQEHPEFREIYKAISASVKAMYSK